MDFTVGAINTDKTNRHESLNTSNKLGDDIALRFTNLSLDVVTLSEVSTLKSVNRFASVLPEDVDVHFRHSDKRSDYIVQAWNSEIFKSDGNYDISGNFIGVPLLHRQTEEPQLHVSVHLPHKNGRKRVRENLCRYVNEHLLLGERQVYIHGDFNATPAELEVLFPNSVLTINGITTQQGGEKDNILIIAEEDESEYEGSIITEEHNYSHHVINTKFTVD